VNRLKWSRRILISVLFSVLFTAIFYFVLMTDTEPWKVYGNDFSIHPPYWILPVLAASFGIAFVAIRYKWVWLLCVSSIPYYVAIRPGIIDGMLDDCIAECASNSSFWFSRSGFDGKNPLPNTTEFAVCFGSFRSVDEREFYYPCPGYKRNGTRTGVAFVGGGLCLAPIKDNKVLIAFCNWACHPPPHDHQHCIIWQYGNINSVYTGSFDRECTNASDMITRIEAALKQAEDGTVSYSKEAVKILQFERDKRKELLGLKS
jgi:hypothetical protein